MSIRTKRRGTILYREAQGLGKGHWKSAAEWDAVEYATHFYVGESKYQNSGGMTQVKLLELLLTDFLPVVFIV